MPERVAYLHVGPPKTGTTHLQALLYANVDLLAGHGLRVIGNHALHFNAASELRGVTGPTRRSVPTGRWAKVCAQVLGSERSDVVLSNERYSLLDAEQAGRAVRDLEATGREVRVVLTMRDPVAIEPSRWQESVKNGASRPWDEFVRDGLQHPERVRNAQRCRRVLDVWPAVVGADRVDVVTVPPAGAPRDLLTSRFFTVLDRADAVPALAPGRRTNPSLDHAATEILRVLQERVDLPAVVQRSWVKSFLANRVLAGAPRTTGSPRLAGEAYAVQRAEGEHLADRIRDLGLRVEGDLADLVCTPEDDRGDAPTIPPDVRAELALTVAAALLERAAEEHAEQAARDELAREDHADAAADEGGR